MFFRCTLLTLLMILELLAQAQESVICGRVVDVRKRPIAGANVSFKDTYDGSTTDSAGFFRFSSDEAGKLMLEVSYTGYHTYTQALQLPQADTVSLVITLKEAPNELRAVVITAGSFEASDEKKITVLKPLDIVTTASANADVAAAMRTLPGTQQVGESAELFVRGGAGYETKQFIDGMVVAHPFFTAAPDLASRGRFSPFLFKGTLFSTGGYSALYGQALSSALILESIDLPERSEASASLSPLFVGGQVQDIAKNKKSSWGASAGYSHLGLYFALVKQRPDFFSPPQGWNADANFRIKTSATGMLKFYVSYNTNVLGLRNADLDSQQYKNAFSVNNKNLYTNLSYKERLANRLVMRAGLSVSHNTDDLQQQLQDANHKPVAVNTPNDGQPKNFTLTTQSLLAQARIVFDYKLYGLSALRWGAEYWYSHDRSRFNQWPSVLTDHFKAGFAEADIYITNAVAARAGLRAEHSSLMSRANLAPRASLSYRTGAGSQLTADYGIFYQKPLNPYLMFNAEQSYLRADHYIFTWQKITPTTTFRAQAFYKDYRQLTKTWSDTNTNGSGYAQGIEFFWRDKKTFKNFDYWVTYSWLDTERDYLNFPYTMRPNFAAAHTANLVVKRFIQKWNLQFNANYQFATGRPYYDIGWQPNEGKWVLRDAGKTIPFHNLSMSVNYLTQIAKSFAVVVLSVNNVLNSRQVFGYRYSLDGQNRAEINPPARQFFFAGLFLSWGTDRRQDVINNNL